MIRAKQSLVGTVKGKASLTGGLNVGAVSDGQYEKGYAIGYEQGERAGYTEGLAARKHETWTITLTDGSVVEKEVALL